VVAVEYVLVLHSSVLGAENRAGGPELQPVSLAEQRIPATPRSAATNRWREPGSHPNRASRLRASATPAAISATVWRRASRPRKPHCRAVRVACGDAPGDDLLESRRTVRRL